MFFKNPKVAVFRKWTLLGEQKQTVRTNFITIHQHHLKLSD